VLVSSLGTFFCAQGATAFLSRTTAILAALFFATSLTLAVMRGSTEGSVDLMDTPAGEEVFADVPLIDGAESVPAIDTLDTLPVINEELPEEVKTIQQEINTMSDSVTIEEDKVIVE